MHCTDGLVKWNLGNQIQDAFKMDMEGSISIPRESFLNPSLTCNNMRQKFTLVSMVEFDMNQANVRNKTFERTGAG